MLPTLMFLYFMLTHARALPIPAVESPNPASTCEDLQHCWTIWDIIWTCIATISVCTWVTVHPNVPAREEGMFTVNFRHVNVVLLVIIMPEAMVSWAVRQWLTARSITKWVQAIMPSSDGQYQMKDRTGFIISCKTSVYANNLLIPRTQMDNVTWIPYCHGWIHTFFQWMTTSSSQ